MTVREMRRWGIGDKEAIELYLELTEHDYTIEKNSEIVELDSKAYFSREL